MSELLTSARFSFCNRYLALCHTCADYLIHPGTIVLFTTFSLCVSCCRNARFCLICNYVNKIIPALQSRCTRFRFPPLPNEFVKNRLSEICSIENVTVSASIASQGCFTLST